MMSEQVGAAGAATAEGMACPVCRVPLVMSERQGVEIDYCPKCRGVWLDRGELDKIIERSDAASAQGRPAPPAPSSYPAQPPYQERGHGGGHGRDSRGGHGHRPRSFLSGLFD